MTDVNRRREQSLAADTVRSLFDYDPETGRLTWRAPKSPTVAIGAEAGAHEKNTGYRRVRIGKDTVIYAQRLVWLYVTGSWPPYQVDHINGDRSDNRWVNLRLATPAENKANEKTRRDNRLGIKGVRMLPNGKFQSGIWRGKKMTHLGVFPTAEEAAAAYRNAAMERFGEFARVA